MNNLSPCEATIVLRYLDPESLDNFSQTSKVFKTISDQDILWNNFLKDKHRTTDISDVRLFLEAGLQPTEKLIAEANPDNASAIAILREALQNAK